MPHMRKPETEATGEWQLEIVRKLEYLHILLQSNRSHFSYKAAKGNMKDKLVLSF